MSAEADEIKNNELLTKMIFLNIIVLLKDNSPMHGCDGG